MAFRIYTDGIFFGVRYTADEPNDADVFSTFPKARAALAKQLRRQAAEYTRSARDAEALTLNDIEEEVDD